MHDRWTLPPRVTLPCMRLHPELLNEPVERAVRIVALRLLERAEKARSRLEHATDPDALHDLRVAVRRLRSWLRSMRPWLRGSAPKKSLRRLERVARVTGASRDAEVHLEWLRAQRSALSARQRHGLSWLVERVEEEKRENDNIVATKCARAFDRAREALARKLPSYIARIDSDAAAPPHLFADVLAELLRAQAGVLARRLTRIEDLDDAKRIHKARLTGKRLRYLAEPIAEFVDGGTELVEHLAQLQDALGDWHDVHVFSSAIVDASETAAREAPVPSEPAEPNESGARREPRQQDIRLGLLALAGRLQERGHQAFIEIRQRWSDPAPIVAEIEAVAQALSSRVGRSLEIERTYFPSTDDARETHEALVPLVPAVGREPSVGEAPGA